MRTERHMPLPTRAQLQQIDDVELLEDLQDRIEEAITVMNVDLEQHGDVDRDWAKRATIARALHKRAWHLVRLRISALTGAAGRRAEANDPLTNEVLAERPHRDPLTLTTMAECDEWLAWLKLRIDAVASDRDEEIALLPAERDEGFLAKTGTLLKAMRATYQEGARRRGDLRRAIGRDDTKQRRREELFIDAARDLLDRDTYLQLWRAVDHMEAHDGDQARIPARAV